MAKGITRKIDELGRITLPMEYRRTFGMKVNALIGMYVVNNVIHLVKADEKFRGIARSLDDLGRLTLPIEVRRTLGFKDREPVDMYVDGEEICIHKNSNECVICGRSGDLFELYPVKDVCVCKNCALAVTDMVMEKNLCNQEYQNSSLLSH